MSIADDEIGIEQRQRIAVVNGRTCTCFQHDVYRRGVEPAGISRQRSVAGAVVFRRGIAAVGGSLRVFDLGINESPRRRNGGPRLCDLDLLRRRRTSMMNAAPVGSFATSHLDVGEISATLQAAEALLRADLAEVMELAEAGRTLNDLQRSNYRCNAAFAARCASRTATLIIDLMGRTAVSDDNPISHIYQDIFVATRHYNLNWNANATEHGRARFRMPLANAVF